jgi:hypothetical protein
VQRTIGWVTGVGQCIPDRGTVDILDPGHHITHLASLQVFPLSGFGSEDPELVHLKVSARGHHPDPSLFVERAVKHPHQGDHTEIIVKPRIDNQGF